MIDIEVVKFTPNMAQELAERMRVADRREVAAMTGKPDTIEDRRQALLDIIRTSRGTARAALLQGQIVAAYGICTTTVLGNVGSPWMLATYQITDERFAPVFARRCKREFFKIIPSHITRLWNMVDETNEIAIRWLEWMNFEFRPETVEHGGIRWRVFEMEAT